MIDGTWPFEIYVYEKYRSIHIIIYGISARKPHSKPITHVWLRAYVIMSIIGGSNINNSNVRNKRNVFNNSGNIVAIIAVVNETAGLMSLNISLPR